MKIALGADHRGAHVAQRLLERLQKEGHSVELLGELCTTSCDYPDSAYLVAKAVSDGDADRGVLICGSGIGMCIAANKVKGVRAALVSDELSAEMSRRHNDANVLCLAADLLGDRLIERIVDIWLATPFEGGRHARRVAKIAAIEQGQDPRSLQSAPAAKAAARGAAS